ncbi:MAG: ABC transporter permease [Gemmatimonadaceae bacterium]
MVCGRGDRHSRHRHRRDSAVFSVVEAVVLRPFPFENPDRVVDPHAVRYGIPVATASNLEYATWRRLPGVFDAVAAMMPGNSYTLTRGDAPQVVTGTRVTSKLTRVIGVNLEIGRGFLSSDDEPGASHVVILSHKLWMKDYNGARSVLGQNLQLDGEVYSIIGAMPASVDVVNGPDALWLPMRLSSTDLLNFTSRQLQLIARLSPGVTRGQAAAAVNASEATLSKQYPMWGNGYTGTVRSYADDTLGNLRARLFIRLGAVGLVFLIACANVANLLLARATTRTHEMAIRAALGAGRQRLVSQLLTESAVLSAVSGVAGVLLAVALTRGSVAASPPGIPRIDAARVDAPVLLVAVGIAALCSIVIGLFPALRASSPRLQAALREGARGSGESKARGLWRNALVATEVALAMTLLTGAGLLIRTAWEISRVDPGFDSSHTLTAQVLLPPRAYPDKASGLRAYRAIQDNVRRAPGVQSAALTSTLPLVQSVRSGVGAEGQPFTEGERLIADLRMVSPGYFSTMRIRLRAGRDFSASDDANSPLVAIINETLAKRFWPGESAIGKRIEGMDPSHRHFMEVIGVLPGVRDVSLDRDPAPEFYIPIEQMPIPLWGSLQGSLVVAARTEEEPMTLERALRRAVDDVDPTLPLASVATMESFVRTSRATARFNMLLLSVLGAIALVLASVGVYGVIAYSVSQRTREIGLRIALGATPSGIAALVVRGGLVPIAIGAGVGTLLSLGATRVLREQLYGVTPGDPTTIVAIGSLLLLMSLVAALIPARRAMRVSPVTALAG